MGLVYVDLNLSNGWGLEGDTERVSALVDTGSNFLCIPQGLADRLGFKIEQKRTKQIELADGSEQDVPYVGPVHVQINDHECFVGALVTGTEVLLGAMPLQDMSLIVEPVNHAVRAG